MSLNEKESNQDKALDTKELLLNMICANIDRENPLYSIFCEDKEIIFKLVGWKRNYEFSLQKEDFKASEEYFKGAIDDLSASKLLYDNEIYDLAVFHIQQAVEKLSKYWAITQRWSTYDKAKHSSHDSLNEFVDLIKYILERLKKALEERKHDENYSKAYNLICEILENIENLKKRKREDIVRSSFEDIKIEIDKLDYQKKRFLEMYDLFIEEYIKTQKIEMPFDILREKLEDYMNAFYLFVIGKYTDPHINTTRYYDKKIDMGPSNYTKELGIVQALPLLIGRIEKAVRSFEKLSSKGVEK